MDLNRITADIELAKKAKASGWIFSIETLECWVDLTKRQEEALRGDAQALADMQLALNEQTELADQCRKQAETLEASERVLRATVEDLQARLAAVHNLAIVAELVRNDEVSLAAKNHAETGAPVVTVDTPKFQQVVEYWRNEPYGTRSFENAWSDLIAHIDSYTAQAVAAKQVEIDRLRFDLHEATESLIARMAAPQQHAQAAEKTDGTLTNEGTIPQLFDSRVTGNAQATDQFNDAVDMVSNSPEIPDISNAQAMAGYEVACRYGIYENQAFKLADEMFAAFQASQQPAAAPSAPAAIGKASVTLESTEGRYSIVMKFNQKTDAFEVHDYLLGAGGKDYRGAPAIQQEGAALDQSKFGKHAGWEHCPECGCLETDPPQEGMGYFCANCGQEWHGDHDYSGVVRANLERLAKSAALASQASKGTGVPKGAAIGSNGTIYYGIAEVAHQAESVESLHMWLDKQGVMRTGGEAELSPVGRVICLLSQKACTEQIEQAIEAAFWEADARRKGYGEWKTRPQSERDAFKWAVRACIGKIMLDTPSPAQESNDMGMDYGLENLRKELGTICWMSAVEGDPWDQAIAAVEKRIDSILATAPSPAQAQPVEKTEGCAAFQGKNVADCGPCGGAGCDGDAQPVAQHGQMAAKLAALSGQLRATGEHAWADADLLKDAAHALVAQPVADAALQALSKQQPDT